MLFYCQHIRIKYSYMSPFLYICALVHPFLLLNGENVWDRSVGGIRDSIICALKVTPALTVVVLVIHYLSGWYLTHTHGALLFRSIKECFNFGKHTKNHYLIRVYLRRVHFRLRYPVNCHSYHKRWRPSFHSKNTLCMMSGLAFIALPEESKNMWMYKYFTKKRVHLHRHWGASHFYFWLTTISSIVLAIESNIAQKMLSIRLLGYLNTGWQTQIYYIHVSKSEKKSR